MVSLKNAVGRSYSGTRATFQRLTDAKILHGWTQSASSEVVVVRTASAGQLHLDEQFSFRLGGGHGDAVFDARLIRIICDPPILVTSQNSPVGGKVPNVERQCMFLVQGGIKIVDSQMEARFRYDHGYVTLNDGLNCAIEDVSASGLGLISPDLLEPKTMVNIRIFDGMSEVVGQAEVRYCRKMRTATTQFRVGLRFAGLDRLNLNRWKAMLDRTF